MCIRDRDYHVKAEDVKSLLPDWKGADGCIATNRITVEGRKVGYCYREIPDGNWDSGWRFTAGDESDEYMDDPNNAGIYKLNTICNDDPDIISLLNTPWVLLLSNGTLILEVGFTLRCLQRLSHPHFASLPVSYTHLVQNHLHDRDIGLENLRQQCRPVANCCGTSAQIMEILLEAVAQDVYKRQHRRDDGAHERPRLLFRRWRLRRNLCGEPCADGL